VLKEHLIEWLVTALGHCYIAKILNFECMEMTVQIPFRQLLTLVKTLTPAQKARLKKELTEETEPVQEKSRLTELLLSGPVLTEKEIGVIEETRKSINQWRTES